MKKHLLIPLTLFITSSLFGQEVIHLDLDVNCQEVNYDSKLEYPLDRGNVDLQVEWLFSSDTVLLNGQISFDDNELVGDLLFFEGLPGKAFDVMDKKFLNIGQGKFKEIFQPKDLMLLKHMKGYHNYTLFVDLHTGDTIQNITNFSGFGDPYQFFSDSILWGSDRSGLYAYSINQQKKVWQKSKRDLGRYESYYSPKGNNQGMYFIYKYSNYRTDSIYETRFYVDAKNWEEVEIKLTDSNEGISTVIDNTMYLYGPNNKYVSVNIPTWKTNWCISGDWKRNFIKKENKWISLKHTIDLTTGEVSFSGNRYDFNSLFHEWGDYFVTSASAGHEAGQEMFLVDKGFEKFYRPHFVYDGELPCDLEIFIEQENSIVFVNTEDKERTVAYFNYGGKTHFMGVKIIQDSWEDYKEP